MTNNADQHVLAQVGSAYVGMVSLAITGAWTALVLKLPGYATSGWFSTVTGSLILVVTQAGALTLMLLMLASVLLKSLTQETSVRGATSPEAKPK